MQAHTLTYADFIDAAGDAFVRELDVSKITVRLKEKHDRKSENDSETTIAKLEGSTLDTLQRCLVGFTALEHLKALADIDLPVQTNRVGA